MTFLEQFDSQWGPQLARRQATFREIFRFLAERRPRGHEIVETGCTRQPNNWAGDGQSSFLFDRFATLHDGRVHSVDIDARACGYARSIVGPRTTVVCEDSVPFLRRLAVQVLRERRQIDLVYLDSFDWDARHATDSAVHHLKELCAILPALGPHTLVVVDDAFRSLQGMLLPGNRVAIIGDDGIGGKARYVAQFFQQIGAPLLFEGYQCGWLVPG